MRFDRVADIIVPSLTEHDLSIVPFLRFGFRQFSLYRGYNSAGCGQSTSHCHVETRGEQRIYEGLETKRGPDRSKSAH